MSRQRSRTVAVPALLAAALAALPCRATEPAETGSAGDEWVVLETTAGDIVINLLEELAPHHAENFKKLVRQGYYDGSPFHRVIDGFMAQGGGQWGPDGTSTDVGYQLEPEIRTDVRHRRGSVAAARRPDAVNPRRRSSGSQFFITYGPAPQLDGEYTVFGHVVAGMDAVDRIVKGALESDGAVPPDQATIVLHAILSPADAVRAARAPDVRGHDH